jgi:hypothetical protein
VRPVLLIDEAQEVSAACLTELRLLQSACFDSESLLVTILCGDGRLPERFRTPELLPLGSRIRTRLQLTALSPEQMEDYLNFALIPAGHPQLMTPELIRTLAAHALNNLRVLNHMAAELLTAAAQRNLPRIDETLYFELFTQTTSKPRRVKSSQPSVTASTGYTSQLQLGAPLAPLHLPLIYPVLSSLILLDRQSLNYRVHSQFQNRSSSGKY